MKYNLKITDTEYCQELNSINVALTGIRLTKSITVEADRCLLVGGAYVFMNQGSSTTFDQGITINRSVIACYPVGLTIIESIES